MLYSASTCTFSSSHWAASSLSTLYSTAFSRRVFNTCPCLYRGMKEETGGSNMGRVWSDGKPRPASIEWSSSSSAGEGEGGGEKTLEPFFGKFEKNVIGLDILKIPVLEVKWHNGYVTNKEREVGESCPTSMGRPQVNKGRWELGCILGVTREKHSLEKPVGDLYYNPFENQKPEASGGILKGFKLPFLRSIDKAPAPDKDSASDSPDKAPDS